MTKVCKTCGVRKKVDQYHVMRIKGKPPHERLTCKSCTYEKNKLWAQENKEKANAIKEKYAKKHPDRVKKTIKAYKERNRERIRRKDAAYRERNRDSERERSARYRKENPIKRKESLDRYVSENPDKVKKSKKSYMFSPLGKIKRRELKHKRRATRTEGMINDPTLNEDLAKLEIRTIAYGKCQLCGAKTTEFHLDHAVPVIRGGEWSRDNLHFCCATCNLRKNRKTLEEFAGISFKDLPVTL